MYIIIVESELESEVLSLIKSALGSLEADVP